MDLKSILLLLLNIIQIIFLIYIGVSTLYVLLYSVSGLFRHKPALLEKPDPRRIAVLIPGYKEDMVILEAAREALLQDYPKEWYDVVVIADSFKPETIATLKSMPIKVIEVKFESSTKAKALNAAMAALPDNYYDIALVLDADNVMDPDFLTRINSAFVPDITAVQGHRVAKNTNTSMAILDAISEEITNHIFRKGHRVLGLSSGLIGSGMAFDYPFYKQIMKDIKAIGGFDKELEHKMLSDRKVIEYLEDVYVYDEKVQDTEVFIKQRRRWLSAQIHYAKYFTVAVRSFFRDGNIDFLDKAYQMLLPPRIILLGVLFLISVGTFFINPLPVSLIWVSLFGCSLLSFVLSVPRKFYNRKTLKALLMLPTGFLLMTFSLITTSGANKKFIHTEHTHVKAEPKKRRLRIGIEAQRLFREKKHGMDIVALELIRHLERIDRENDYFIFVKPGSDRCFRSSNRFRVIELYGEPYPIWEQVLLPLAAAWHKCDLLHCTSSTAPIFSPVPLVLTLHDIFFLEHFSLENQPFSLYQRLGKWYRKMIVPRVVKKSVKVITVSRSEQIRISSFFSLDNKNFHVIYNGVSDQFRKIPDNDQLENIKKKFGLPDEFIFFLGNTDPKKNTPGVFLAYRKFLRKYGKGIPLVVADISHSNFLKILRRIGAEEISASTRLLSYVPNTDLPAIYNLCTLYLYPSLRESFGIPILEAQSCGTPVITSNVFSMPEVGGDGAAYVNPNDPEELADSIQRLITSNDLRISLIEKGYLNAQKFKWETMAAKILEIYLETEQK